MMRKCHLNTCPVGVATQDPVLRKKFSGRPEHVVNFFFFVAEEVRQIMAQLGVRKFDDLIGRADLLDTRKGIEHWKARGLDFGRLFAQPKVPDDVPRHHVEAQDHGLQKSLDIKLIEKSRPAIEKAEKVQFIEVVRNVNRSVGAMLSGELTKAHPQGLPDDSIRIQLEGTGGQSFGRISGARHHAVPDRRCQRLHRQRAFRWARRSASQPRFPRRGGAQHDRRQHRSLRSKPPVKPICAAWPASALRCGFPVPRQWSKAPGTTVAST